MINEPLKDNFISSDFKKTLFIFPPKIEIASSASKISLSGLLPLKNIQSPPGFVKGIVISERIESLATALESTTSNCSRKFESWATFSALE